jgi:hypothetical protein
VRFFSTMIASLYSGLAMVGCEWKSVFLDMYWRDEYLGYLTVAWGLVVFLGSYITKYSHHRYVSGGIGHGECVFHILIR